MIRVHAGETSAQISASMEVIGFFRHNERRDSYWQHLYDIISKRTQIRTHRMVERQDFSTASCCIQVCFHDMFYIMSTLDFKSWGLICKSSCGEQKLEWTTRQRSCVFSFADILYRLYMHSIHEQKKHFCANHDVSWVIVMFSQSSIVRKKQRHVSLCWVSI